MPWGKNDKSFKDTFGMEETEMRDMITGAATKKDLDAITTRLDKVDAVEKDVSSIKEMLVALSNANTNNVEELDENGDKKVVRRTNKLTAFADDPDQAFAERMGPVMGLALATRAEVVMDKILGKEKYGEILRDEVEKLVAKEPLESRIRPEYIKNAYDIVVARNIDTIQNDNTKREGRFFLEGSRSTTTTLDTRGEKKPVLSEEELAYAKKFNMTEEQYIKSKGGLKYV